MSMRYQAAILTASHIPLKTPNAPTIGAATAGNGQVSVAFTAPSDVGGGAITSYQVVVTDSSSGAVFLGSGSSSPITITGLTNGNSYTARVAAINAFGAGPFSTNSSSFTPINPYSQSYTTAGTYSWIAPAGYTAMNIIVIGGGGSGGMGGGGTAGGGGGGYAKSINLAVTPGNSYTVLVGGGGVEGSSPNQWYQGTGGGTSSFAGTIVANGGQGAFNNSARTSGGTASGGNNLNLTGGYGGAGVTGGAGENGGNGPTGGGAGYYNTSPLYVGGTANQLYGGNGGSALSSPTQAGQNGFNYGGGGSGGSSRAGGTPNEYCKGAGGAVFIYYP